jgi:hypothetical protein
MTTWKVFGEEQLIVDGPITYDEVDLDHQIIMVDGERLTEARAEQISEEIMEVVYEYYGMEFTPRKLDHQG